MCNILSSQGLDKRKSPQVRTFRIQCVLYQMDARSDTKADVSAKWFATDKRRAREHKKARISGLF